MYTLLLVDDEPLILDGLYNNVHWEESGITSVFKAENAVDALAIAGRYRVDAVVADISMPGMDGVEMSQHIRKMWPLCKIVLLSGYREFSYAQKAVEIGVYQYLVKPVSYEDLQATVEGALGELKKELDMHELLEMAREKLHEAGTEMRDQLLGRWLAYGRIRLDEAGEEMKAFGIPVHPGMYGFAMLTEWDRELDTPVRQVALREMMERLLPRCEARLFVPLWGGEVLFAFLSETREEAASLRTQCHNGLDVLQEAAQESLDTLLSITVGPVERAEDMGGIYKRLRSYMRRQYPEPGSLLLWDGETMDGQVDLAALNEAVHTLDGQAIMQWIGEAETAGEGKTSQQGMAMILFAVICSDASQRGIPLETIRGICDRLMQRMAQENGEDSVTACSDAAEKYIKYVRETQSGQKKKLVEDVRMLIHQRMAEGITVSAIAEELHYNPNYLSQLIRQETGAPLEKMLISMRVEHACALLREGTQVQEAALQVGYDNLAHFGRVFKRQMGISPRMYAAEYRG